MPFPSTFRACLATAPGRTATETRGTALINSILAGWTDYVGEMASRPTGALVADRSGVSTASQTFTIPSVSGDLIVVGVKWGNQAISVASIGDDKGNNYTNAVGPTNWSGTAKRAQIFYAKNIIGGGAPITITVTLTGIATSSFYIYQLEYSNADINAPLDVVSAAIGTSTFEIGRAHV